MKYLLSLIFLCTLTFTSMGQNSDCINIDFMYEVTDELWVFKGKSDKEVTEWYWSMGDGQSHTGQKIRHKFEKSGIYEVCLKVRAGENCTKSICKKIEVKVRNNSNCDLGADFKFDLKGRDLTVAARSNAGQNVKYIWDFGDGKQSRGQEVAHKFAKEGTYNVCLMVTGPNKNTDSGECTQKICKIIKINTSNQDCSIKADFKIDIRENIVVVEGRSNLGNNAQYTWVFGDGSRAQGIQAKHAYKQRGNYQICLIVSSRLATSTAPCMTRVCKNIRIGNPDITNENDCKIEADFQYKNDGNYFGFSAKSNDRGATYYWSISGQNSRLMGQNIEITLDNPGLYDVCLIVVSKEGQCKTRVCKKVVVGRNITPYPNPTTDILYFQNDEETSHFKIVDRFNGLVLEGRSQPGTSQIDVSGLTTGVYTLIINFHDGSTQSKLFVKR